MVRKSNERSKTTRPPKKLPGGATRRNALVSSRTVDRRLAIVRAAGMAFRRFGLRQAGMREIAGEAGLSPANLYYYFKDKKELLFFCQDQALDRMLARLRQAQGRRQSPDRRLAAAIRAQILCMLDDLAGAVAHLEIDALTPEDRKRLIRKRDRYERSVRRIIAEGVREGVFQTGDPALATRVILGAVNWCARWYQPGGPTRPSEIADHFADYLVGGLLSRRPGARS